METRLKKMMAVLFSIVITANLFATGSIAIEGHVLSVDYQADDFRIESVIIIDSDGSSILYSASECNENFCTYQVGENLPNWTEVWVVTNSGTFKFYKI